MYISARSEDFSDPDVQTPSLFIYYAVSARFRWFFTLGYQRIVNMAGKLLRQFSGLMEEVRRVFTERERQDLTKFVSGSKLPTVDLVFLSRIPPPLSLPNCFP